MSTFCFIQKGSHITAISLTIIGLAHTALVHGIEIPDETPLQWLGSHMCNPDNFIHICVV